MVPLPNCWTPSFSGKSKSVSVEVRLQSNSSNLVKEWSPSNRWVSVDKLYFWVLCLGIIKVPDSRILLKVVQDDQRGICEEQLYKDVSEARQNNRTDFPALYNLYDLIPRFYGLQSIQIGRHQKLYTFFKLEDIICSYTQPCVMVSLMHMSYYLINSGRKDRQSLLWPLSFEWEKGRRIKEVAFPTRMWIQNTWLSSNFFFLFSS